MIRITVVTFRRPRLLKRALESIRAQTVFDWRAEVVNDDPDDRAPAEIVDALSDSRIQMHVPERHRGATANLNLAFRSATEPFATLLEDDNWWEPDFLHAMTSALERHPSAALVTGNQRIWRELPDGGWSRTERTVRTERDELRFCALDPVSKCGSATLANSALMFRPGRLEHPDLPLGLPVDVSEHYRERLIPHPFLVLDRVVANYAVTLNSARSADPFDWTKHQVLLTASVFAVVPEEARSPLASALVQRARASSPLELTPLLLAGRFVSQARPLWGAARLSEKLRLAAHLAAHPSDARRYRTLVADHPAEWSFLQQGWVADTLRTEGHLPSTIPSRLAGAPA